jgi:hypothetical protein
VLVSRIISGGGLEAINNDPSRLLTTTTVTEPAALGHANLTATQWANVKITGTVATPRNPRSRVPDYTNDVDSEPPIVTVAETPIAATTDAEPTATAAASASATATATTAATASTANNNNKPAVVEFVVPASVLPAGLEKPAVARHQTQWEAEREAAAKSLGPPPTMTDSVVGAGTAAVNAVISTAKHTASQLAPRSLWARMIASIPFWAKRILAVAAVVQTLYAGLCLYVSYLLMVMRTTRATTCTAIVSFSNDVFV